MFLKNLIKKAKTVVDTTEEIDNLFFAQVMEELETGFKDKGINGKAIAMSAGDEAKANSLYIELRAKALQEEFERAKQRENENDTRYHEKIRDNIVRELSSDLGNILKMYEDELLSHGFTQKKKDFFGYYYLIKEGKRYDVFIDVVGHAMTISHRENVALTINLEDKFKDL